MDEDQSQFRPPYMSFQTFWRFIEELRSKPLPPQIDRSLMASKSGTDQANLNLTLATFDLVGPSGEVTRELNALVHGDEAGRKMVLRSLIEQRYADALKVSLANGTSQQLQEAFRDAYGMAGADTRRKAVTFFLHACREADVELSPYFPSTRAGSGAPGVPRPRRPQRRKATAATPVDASAETTTRATAPGEGDVYSVALTSGGTVRVAVSVNLFDLSTEDRTFVIELVDKLKGYANAAQPATDKGAGVS